MQHASDLTAIETRVAKLCSMQPFLVEQHFVWCNTGPANNMHNSSTVVEDAASMHLKHAAQPYST
jgi:hypothetical protein